MFEEEEKEKEDATLPDEALDEVLGGDAELDDEDDPLMAEEPSDEEGRDWA